MARSLAMLHTVIGLVPTFEDLVQRTLPGWWYFNIVDESLLKNTIRESKLSAQTMRRVAGHIWSAVDAGADAILVTCSSIGPAVDATRPLCPVPLVRVDEGMADAALEIGERIGVLATLATTLEPTRDLICQRAALAGKSPQIIARLCEGAFDQLMTGDREGHDALVAKELIRLSAMVDVVVLAQASMARVLGGETAAAVRTPVLSSPELGVARLRQHLAA